MRWCLIPSNALTFAVAAIALRLLLREERVFIKAALGHGVGKKLPAQFDRE